jgi:ribosomal protein S18 acetylase RimI-like enzyme
MGSEPNVRRGTPEDAEVLAELLRRFNAEYEPEPIDVELTAERARDLMETGEGVFFLAGENEDPGSGTGPSEPLGFAYLQFNPSLYSRTRDAYLGELYVVPDRRGEGMGRAMMEAVIAEARARDAINISLGTSVDDTEARGLYESVGFTNNEGKPDGPSMLFYEMDL